MKIFFGLTLASMLAFYPGTSEAHDEYHSWTRPVIGGSCCNNTDCKVVRWRINREAQLELEVAKGKWVVPPASTEIKDKVDPKGEAHWCGYVGTSTITHYCYLPPRPGT